jgi:iron transport multicopper oxidase
VRVVGAKPIIIRFKADNYGPWLIHCHIGKQQPPPAGSRAQRLTVVSHADMHLEAGLAAVFIEDPKGTKELVKPDPAWQGLCDSYYKLDPSLQ